MQVLLNFCNMTATTMSPLTEAQSGGMSLQDVVTRNIKIAMVIKGAKQKDLADALGVNRSAISQKMTRRVNWNLEDIEKASGFFHVKPEALVAGQGFEPWTSGL
ncbi:helix-turn-helix transcriptional regulator [Bifidobacterium pseudolongum]|uniref:Helix-turn-helix transcriptional regulator n=1 Tax=Bifidobacterium pseudolongum TaxID=1694 RepID=A0A4S4F872_9BIFI|nr:helix-turn-helix transcriptional regulator [Bifidobacterium pseudolongum]